MSVFKLFNLNRVNILDYGNLYFRIFLKCKEQQCWISIKKFKMLGLPSPPKRPLNAFLKFQQIIRPTIINKEPQISFGNFIKIAANEWKKYDPEQKKLIQNECKLLKQNYISEFKNYKKSLTAEQYNIIKNVNNDQKKNKKLIEKREKNINFGYPKRPTTSFFQFVIEKQNKKNSGIKQNEWIKMLSKEWKNISEFDKEKYKKQFKVELDKYKCDKIIWKKNIIKQQSSEIIES